MQHISDVRNNIGRFIQLLLDRAAQHDLSKLASPEVEAFTEHTDKLASSDYGSKEYEDRRKLHMGEAIQHHYALNRHHPEHFKNGIEDMNIIDMLEMFCDWEAASKRHNTGNLRRSIEINADRFRMSPQLVKIFENSVELLDS